MHKRNFCSKLDWIGATWNSGKKAVCNIGETWNKGDSVKVSPQNKSSQKEMAGKRLEPPTRNICYNILTW